MAAQTQAPEIPCPEACCRKELLKSWCGPVAEQASEGHGSVVVGVSGELVTELVDWPATASATVCATLATVGAGSPMLDVFCLQQVYLN